MMDPSYMGGEYGGSGFGFLLGVWLLWLVVWTVNSVLAGYVLYSLAKYLKSKTK